MAPQSNKSCFSFLILISVCIFSLVGCGYLDDSKSKNSPQLPTRQLEGQTGEFNLTVAGSGIALTAEKTITVDLVNNNYNANPVNGAVVPTCMGPLPDNFELGSVTCVATNNSVRLLAKHVTQVCSAGANPYEPIPAKESLSLLGCEGSTGNIKIHAFDPAISATFK